MGSNHDHSHGHSHDHKDDHDHSHSHGHGHSHHHHHAIGNIKFAFALNFIFSIVELVGGLMIGSMAIVADAIHDFGDSISLGAAWFFEGYANKDGDKKFNFGYRRFSLLSALISGVVITTGSIIIIVESIRRFGDAQAPAAKPMMILAAIGLAVNGLAAFRLSRGKTQNEKVLTWHLIEDVAGWSVVLVGAFVIHLTGWTWVDPVLALGLAAFIAFNVLRHLKETAYLFLQGRPAGFDEKRFIAESLAIHGVEHIDHIAVWSLDGDSSVLSARLHLHSVRDPVEIENVKAKVRELAESQSARATLETCMAEGVPHHDD